MKANRSPAKPQPAGKVAGKLATPTRPAKATKGTKLPPPRPMAQRQAIKHTEAAASTSEHVPVKLQVDVPRKAKSTTRQRRIDPLNEEAHAITGNAMGLKNLSTKPKHYDGGSGRVDQAIAKMFKADDLMSPDVLRYCRLLDKPFEAEWGDEGEQPVRPPVYAETTPPSNTTTIRMFGQKRVVVNAGNKLMVAFCVGPANDNDPAPGFSSDDRLIAANVGYGVSGPGTMAFFAGCPTMTNGNFNGANLTTGSGSGGTTQAGGQGCAGYMYQGSAASAAALITDTSGIGDISGAGSGYSGVDSLLTWSNRIPVAEANAGQPSAFKYRPVAGGIMVTPTDAATTLGGSFTAAVIPSANNFAWARIGATTTHGTSSNIGDFYGLPDHVIERGDSCFTVNWLPSRTDFSFSVPYGQPSNGVGNFNPVPFANTEAGQARTWIELIPANLAAASYTLTYVAFYEVAGIAVNYAGNVPRPQPSLGAKVATAIQNNLYEEIEQRDRQVEDQSTLEVLKDHPKIGPMVERAQTAPEAKSMLSEIASFAKDVIPLAAALF